MKATDLMLMAVVVAASACGGSSSPMQPGGGQGGGHSATITASGQNTAPNYFFSPTPDTIKVGSTLTFTASDVLHDVFFDTPGSPQNIGDIMNSSVSRVFPTAGTFNYHCAIHPFMTGVVVVQ